MRPIAADAGAGPAGNSAPLLTEPSPARSATSAEPALFAPAASGTPSPSRSAASRNEKVPGADVCFDGRSGSTVRGPSHPRRSGASAEGARMSGTPSPSTSATATPRMGPGEPPNGADSRQLGPARPG